jgi:hypothetical protein
VAAPRLRTAELEAGRICSLMTAPIGTCVRWSRRPGERGAVADAIRERRRQRHDDAVGTHASVLVHDLEAVGVVADEVHGQPRATASPSSSAARSAVAWLPPDHAAVLRAATRHEHVDDAPSAPP